MGPRGPSRVPKYRKPTSAKTLKTHVFFRFLGVQGLPRQFLKTQEGSQEAINDLAGQLTRPSLVGQGSQS